MRGEKRGRAASWMALAVALLVVVAWPPERGRSLVVSAINWAVDPWDQLPTLPPQLVRAVAQALDGGVIIRHRLRRVGFLLLARLEQALGAVLVFILGHAHITREDVESSVSSAQRTC